MNFAEIKQFLDLHANDRLIIPNRTFNKLFNVFKSDDDGNCLFSSVEILHSEYTQSQLRNRVCEYYKHFNMNGHYGDNTIKGKLQIQLYADDMDEDGTSHRENICKDAIWGGVADIIALADILRVNIVLMNMSKEGYTVLPFEYSPHAKTLFIKYNGKNHFQPLTLKKQFLSPQSIPAPPSSRKQVKTPTKSATRKRATKSTRSSPSYVSPETLNAIQDAETNVSPETLKAIEDAEAKASSQLVKASQDTEANQKPLFGTMEPDDFFLYVPIGSFGQTSYTQPSPKSTTQKKTAKSVTRKKTAKSATQKRATKSTTQKR